MHELEKLQEKHHNVPMEALMMKHHNHPHLRSNHWNTWYNARADYQTNALSYYDYLAEMNLLPLLFEDIINYLLSRDLVLEETSSIKPTKKGDWGIGDSILTISNILKVSSKTVAKIFNKKTYQLKNALTVLDDGAYVPDVTDILIDLQSEIDDNGGDIIKIYNTDVADHLSLSTDKNTLTLTRKLLTGVSQVADVIKIGIGDIITRITNIENNMGKFHGGTVTVLEDLWNGEIHGGNRIPVTLTDGSYQIFIENTTSGSYSVRMPYSHLNEYNAVDVSFMFGFQNPNGDVGWVKCILDKGSNGNGLNPLVTFHSVKIDINNNHTVTKNDTGWMIKVIKKEKAVTIG